MDLHTHPIFIVDDDTDDEDIIRDAMKELGMGNQLKFFHTAEELLNELNHNPVIPFLIICDINLPGMDGFQLREQVLKEGTSGKSVPYIFWSTTASEVQIKKAYDLSAHGFFLKGKTYKDLKEGLNEIIKYWTLSQTPSNSK